MQRTPSGSARCRQSDVIRVMSCELFVSWAYAGYGTGAVVFINNNYYNPGYYGGGAYYPYCGGGYYGPDFNPCEFSHWPLLMHCLTCLLCMVV